LKKLGILITLAMVVTVAGVASANKIIFPFFNDGDGLHSGPINTGMRTFLRVKNLDPETIVCSITYTDVNAIDATPTENTFVLAPLATVGFRPVAESVVEEGEAGMRVPNALPIGSFDAAGIGGCEISSANNIVGMVSEENWFVGGGSGLAPAIQ